MFTNAMHLITSHLQTPIIIVLVALVVIMVVIVGMVITEIFTERRYFTLDLPRLVDDLQVADDTAQVVRESGMLWRQKKALLEILSHPDAPDSDRESLAVDLVTREQSVLDGRTKITDLIAKIAPLIGLMGTLIPLGPGIVAIGDGSTEILSQSLLIAFDTTIMGLVIAAIALCVSTLRKHWYVKYMSAFEAATECVLAKANERANRH